MVDHLHDSVMIALYYCYVDVSNHMSEHLIFQESVCNDLSLSGRVRISPEGINGVLSGTTSDLKKYEQLLAKNLDDISVSGNSSSCTNTPRYGNTLDIKYCHLRSDIPIEKQLFTTLSVKFTKEVVSLMEGTTTKTSEKTRRGRNKRSNKKHQSETSRKSTEIDTVIHMNNYEPATHLSPKDWNKELLLSRDESDAILLDARNCYESAVGHFKVEGLPTLLTNTRKYSTIPDVLKANADKLAGKKVMMYCTGGVRCERASSYLRAFAESDTWPEGMEKPKAVYQLQGGIQKYLEVYGTKENEQCRLNNNVDDICLYAGRNFVFDPRRIDPIVGISGKAVGRCILCKDPHDDYDNGFAPCEEKEARCCRCRVLILICNKCRHAVKVWGEADKDDSEKPELYCGGTSICINEGNAVEHSTLVL